MKKFLLRLLSLVILPLVVIVLGLAFIASGVVTVIVYTVKDDGWDDLLEDVSDWADRVVAKVWLWGKGDEA